MTWPRSSSLLTRAGKSDARPNRVPSRTPRIGCAACLSVIKPRGRPRARKSLPKSRESFSPSLSGHAAESAARFSTSGQLKPAPPCSRTGLRSPGTRASFPGKHAALSASPSHLALPIRRSRQPVQPRLPLLFSNHGSGKASADEAFLRPPLRSYNRQPAVPRVRDVPRIRPDCPSSSLSGRFMP
jgi:hypothetical protein